MKERPILMSGPMVRAILEGRKAQTRRVVKRQESFDPRVDLTGAVPEMRSRYPFLRLADGGEFGGPIRCPYGQPGDRLWVRETWANYQTVNHVALPDGRAFSEVSDGQAAYRADGHDTIQDLKDHIRLMSGLDLEAVEVRGDRWIPSIHMPRWACRLVLEITAVRVERLQGISAADVTAEGCDTVGESMWGSRWWVDAPQRAIDDAVGVFRNLWTSTYGQESWDANPWVWVIEFRKAAQAGEAR